jgi:hypothetical protein
MRPSHSFDLVVVGAGGGPDETNLSASVPRSPPFPLTDLPISYLLKPHDTNWDDGILALEAGKDNFCFPCHLLIFIPSKARARAPWRGSSVVTLISSRLPIRRMEQSARFIPPPTFTHS